MHKSSPISQFGTNLKVFISLTHGPVYVFGSVSVAWNGIWLARVRRHDQGWTAEVEIPFRTLNFNPNAEAWGANFQRTIRRKNEENFWSGWGRIRDFSTWWREAASKESAT